jgi:site-specific recombinase XerD
MEDSVVIQDFLSYLSLERRFSEHTAKCYGVDLRQFGEYLLLSILKVGRASSPFGRQHASPNVCSNGMR